MKGKGVPEGEEAPLFTLEWTTKERKLRKKDVLNPHGDAVTLLDENNVEVSLLLCTFFKKKEPI